MYKVIIADDEDLIRESLRKYIDWESMGFTVVGTASDGKKAFELANELQPHVVLTDIKMPHSSGIQLMGKLKRNGMNAKIVVLSGYDEFEYAQAAIEVGAVGYLLKPIKFDKLKEVMLKIKRDYDLSIHEQIKQNQASVLLRGQFLKKLVHGAFGAGEDLHEQAGNLGIRLGWRQFSIFMLTLDVQGEGVQRYKPEEIHLLLNESEQVCNRFGQSYGFPMGDQSVGLLIGGESYSDAELKQTAEELKRKLENLLKTTVTLSLSGICRDLRQIPQAFQTVRELLDRKFFVGRHTLLSADNAHQQSHDMENNPKSLNADRLAVLVQSMDLDAVEDFIEAHFSNLTTKDAVYDLFYQFMHFAEKYMDKSDLQLSAFFDRSLLNNRNVSRKETLAEVIADVKRLFASMIDSLDENRHKQGNRLIDGIIKIVREHYTEDISLDSVAEQMYIHPIYLSRIFKKETGKNFIDYVTEQRVMHAKQLLKNISLRTYEISEMVGYKNARHFSKVFKNLTGNTPKEYRKLVLGYVDDLND